MRRSTAKTPPTIEKWTKEDVHRWLTAEVKVQESCADRFCAEEVEGDSLVVFEKTDILELGIKHGPAVKISSHLEGLKNGSQHESPAPAYVRNWTKEQVNQWLLQHVRAYGKYAERLLEEDVSGDCLVCFRKQDFQDLGVKGGPAVKILAELRELNKKPEPTLQPIPHAGTGCSEAPKLPQREPSLPQAATTDSRDRPESTTVKSSGNESEKTRRSVEKVPEEEEMQPQPQNLRAWRKETAATAVLPGNPTVTVRIQRTLEDLEPEDLKKFSFHLNEYAKSQNNPISWGKLSTSDTMDITKLMTDHFGREKALQVTKHILKGINQNDLVCRMEKDMGHQEQQRLSKEALKKEPNQGDKLKNLLTCGGNSLSNYERFVVVVNKSRPQQVQYLQFLSKLKLFCVLDFDPGSSTPGGLCYSYRESRVANLHTPSQYQGQTDSVVKNLNLYKQTSWVFCNGRMGIDSQKELDYRNWLRKSCRDVELLVSFICNPDVLPRGKSLIIFLLLSPVDTEKDPVFDTYRSFIKHIDEEGIVTICESKSIYFQWKELIKEKCDIDIDHFSIYELTLNQISGTIMALGPFNQSSGRLIPSSGSSVVVLKQKDEDLMTALDILCLNQCENIYDENSQEFKDFRIKVEEEFYRGGKVKWWNFYFCDTDKGKPFVKRNKYKKVKDLIRSQLRASKDMCDVLNLFHQPGCGGTTLAMHVMWDLRGELRCAVLKDNKLPKSEVANQVRSLMKLESEKPCPVLLLVDDSKETENPHELVNCIHKAAVEDINVDDTPNCKVIILNCVRSHSPKEQYQKHNPMQSQYITASLTQDEQMEFEKKLKELEETHEKTENFYSFMIMKSNFDQKYIDDVAHNTLENFDASSKKARLFAYLALLNTNVPESEMSLSLCEDFLGMKMIRWGEDSVLDRMKPYSNFLIIDTVEEWGYKGIRILHHSIASACLEELEKNYYLKVSEIIMEILGCDLLFSVGVVKNSFMLSIQRMLIERQRRKDGDEREPFSPLINKIHSQQGRQTVQEIFVRASVRYETSASIPQALARYLYIKERPADYPEALKWAEKAKNIKQNPYTFDTIGQIHKSNLKTNLHREKEKMSHNPEDLNTNIKLADSAITAFKRAQELGKAEEEPKEEDDDDDGSDDYPRKSYNVYGYVGVLEIAFLVFEILGKLPFFEERVPLKKRYLRSFLENMMPITSVYKENNELNSRYVEVLRDHERFLLSLKTEVKETFEIVESYFTYIKANSSEFDSKNRSTVGGLFKLYVNLFCSSAEGIKEVRQTSPTLALESNVEERRLFLERNQADTFTGILQRLDKPVEEIEMITESYAFLQKQQQYINRIQKTKETINYILSNIVLYLLKPKSKLVKSYSHLSALLQQILQDVGHRYIFPDPYYLALLLFWPSPIEENPEIAAYVRAIRNSSYKRLTLLFRNRSTVAHLYLGKEQGLKRLVSKPQLDETFKGMHRSDLAQLWRKGDIFKEKAIIKRLHRVRGTIEQGEVFANYGKLKIPVRPALLGGIRSGFSTEKVSFYLGFAINGPLAYDIQYEN